METNHTREELIQDVIERELVMFLDTKNMGGTASCQENPDMFRQWRWMIFSVLSDSYIASYRGDLDEAKRVGRNLMTEKYARMDNLIPCVSPNMDKVRKISATERLWMQQLFQEFPLLFPQSLARFDMYFLRKWRLCPSVVSICIRHVWMKLCVQVKTWHVSVTPTSMHEWDWAHLKN
ncbi:hypothetical protein MKHDV_00515 [Halodesulfovibrio sp. MK-HDV]|nr:DUF4125 family protein [Halodesulfovibrio sp. MK-HDV]KAF1077451.1 hypothetical protein MKHDV_00515 [Halodesulfovibrio sp. MK-HDV]